MKKSLYLLIFFASAIQAEQYSCTYSWEGANESHPVQINVQGNKAVIRSGIFKPTYEVVSNTGTELLLYRAFTKENSGSDYPVGFTVMTLDKETEFFTRSNTFAQNESNAHAFGKCNRI